MNYGNTPGAPPPPPGGYGQPPGYGPPAGYGAVPGTYDAVGNPYAAPVAGMQLGANGKLPGGAMKWLYIVGFVGYFLFVVGGLAAAGVAEYTARAAGQAPGTGDAGLWNILPAFGVPFAILIPVAVLIWIYQCWSTIPYELRRSGGGTPVSPGKAIGFLFIPFFNLYWMFVVNVGLCDALNMALMARGGQPRAPRGLAIAACVTNLIPYCNGLVSPILWTIYMFQVDRARRELLGIAA